MPTTSGHTTAICANTVIGTSVRDSSGDQIGKVEDIVLDKTTNNIMFAVVGFGGVLGMGEKFHPLPWSALSYDEGHNAYVVGLSKDELAMAPAATIEELTQGDGYAIRDQAFSHYKATPYWS